MQTDLLNLYPNLKNKTSVIYNPVSLEILNYANSNDLSKIKKENYLLCVGSLKKPNAFHYAIEGFASIANQFPELRLKIVGRGELENAFKRHAERYSVLNRVDFEGFQKNIINYYLFAKATLLTSFYEGFPNVLIESITLGNPIVSFDCPSGPSEIVEEGINGYLAEFKNVSDLKNKLAQIMSNKFIYQKISLTASKYNTIRIVKNYEELLSSPNLYNYKINNL